LNLTGFSRRRGSGIFSFEGAFDFGLRLMVFPFATGFIFGAPTLRIAEVVKGEEDTRGRQIALRRGSRKRGIELDIVVDVVLD